MYVAFNFKWDISYRSWMISITYDATVVMFRKLQDTHVVERVTTIRTWYVACQIVPFWLIYWVTFIIIYLILLIYGISYSATTATACTVL